jgi:hypothetical protein
MILNKLLFTIPLAILLIPFASAEKITIDVPFDSHGTNCFITDNVNELLYTCIFEGNIQTFTQEDLKIFESVLTENQVDEIIQQLEQEELKAITESKITPNDKLILKLEQKRDNGNIDSQDIVLLQMIKELELCSQGVGRSSVIQEYNEFDISNYASYQFNHIKVEGMIGELVKNIEICKAQNVLETQILSQQYNSISVFNDNPTFSLLEHYQGLSALPFDKLTATTTDIDMSAICDNHQFTRSYKDIMGCESIKYDGFTYPKGNGFISYYSPILEEYTFFMQDYGDKQATEKAKQIQADKAGLIAREMIESNHFWKNHNK